MGKTERVRGRLVVHGNIQKVGYRAFVSLIAGNLDIDGCVRNLPDRTVEIHYDCPKEELERFKQAINRKAVDITDPMQINVTKIEEFDENSKGFDPKFIRHPFEVEYDSGKMKQFEKESLERSEMAILAMTSMKQDLGSKQDVMLDQQKETVETIKDMDKNLSGRFDWLAERYGEFGEKMTNMENDMHDIKDDIHEMKEAFVKLVDHMTKE